MNTQQLETLRAVIEASERLSALLAAQDYAGLAAEMNTATAVQNPEAQQDKPKRHALLELFGAVQPSEALAIYNVPDLKADLSRAADSNDTAAIAAYFQLIVGAGLLSVESQAAVAALLAETEPDPIWTATIAGPSLAAAAGLPVVRPADVQAVDHLQ